MNVPADAAAGGAFIHAKTALLGSAVFLCGALIYAFARPKPSLWLADSLHRFDSNWNWFVPWTAALPTLCHVLGMSLLMVATLRPCRLGVVVICTSWFAINAVFEAGQHSALRSYVVSALSQSLPSSAIRDSLTNYFLRGTFDALDLVAAGTGAFAAFAIAGLQSRSPRRRAP